MRIRPIEAAHRVPAFRPSLLKLANEVIHFWLFEYKEPVALVRVPSVLRHVDQHVIEAQVAPLGSDQPRAL